jgi:hypothetical protein
MPVATLLTIALIAFNDGELAPAGPASGLQRAIALAAVVEVTNDQDTGPGSFRAAVEQGNADPSVTFIRFDRGIVEVELASTLVYTGPQPLRIDGRGAALSGSATCDCDVLVTTGGGGLLLENLTIENASRNGVLVEVPKDARGDVRVDLRAVTLRDNGLNGLVVDDQVSDDGIGADSDAGIVLVIASSTVLGNGFRAGFSDFDGVRIDEGGGGGLEATIHDSRFADNAGDGLELDERGDGNATADVWHSVFDANGEQPQDPDDLEDGLDVDEANDGDVDARIVGSTANGNFDQGFDLSEDGAGSILLWMTLVDASGNGVEGIKLIEDEEDAGGGGIDARLQNVTASESQTDDGVQVEEFGPGDLAAHLVYSTLRDNAADGVHVAEDGEGQGVLHLQAVAAAGNGGDPVDATGVEVIRVP